METSKARLRRVSERFFYNYCHGEGIDLGCGDDPLASRYGIVHPFDEEHGDATLCDTIPDERFDFVYASHVLEHLKEPHIALRNWWRILKTGGFLIIVVPHRDIYEKKKTLPSKWNRDHKTFWLPEKSDNSDTIGLREFIDKNLTGHGWQYLKTVDTNTITDPDRHSDGEYSIEAVIQKCPIINL